MNIDSLKDLLEYATNQEQSLGQAVLTLEADALSQPPKVLMEQMTRHVETMQAAIHRGLHDPLPSVSGQSGQDAGKLNQHSPCLVGSTAHRAMVYALSIMEVNAAMGKVIAAPTAGSCGIIPGVLFAVSERKDLTPKQLVLPLFAAGGIGQIIGQNATLSGAEGGCQAECGSAAAMAAAAIVELLKGHPAQALQGSALALKNTLGLACDPVAGLVEIPCIKRNALTALLALGAAEMALAGIVSAIPVDQVIGAMDSIGRSLPPELKETATGGLAQTPRGQEIAQNLYGGPKK